MNTKIGYLLDKFNITPVLLDIGAAGSSPSIWKSIQEKSIYIGFDPDKRDFPSNENGFLKSYIINKALVENDTKEVEFFLTKSPHCSSVLKPNAKSLKEYAFADLFTITRTSKSETVTLQKLATSYNIKSYDWIKTDTQGTDLRLFTSMPNELRNTVLAIDMEPGLIDAYEGEDLFIDVHKEMIRQGFWLSHMNTKGSAKIRQKTIRKLLEVYNINKNTLLKSIRESPGWVELRYLRSLDWLQENNKCKETYIKLWTFSIIDKQAGYATDLIFQYNENFGNDDVANYMLNNTLNLIK